MGQGAGGLGCAPTALHVGCVAITPDHIAGDSILCYRHDRDALTHNGRERLSHTNAVDAE